VEFRVLGPVEVWHGGRVVPIGAPMQRAVLAVLLLRPGCAVSVDTLVDQLWGQRPPETARVTVRNYVCRLRRRLPWAELETEPPGYRLRIPADTVDLWRFERRLRRARDLSSGDPAAAVAELSAALALWRDQPLSNLGPVPLRHVETPRLLELHAGALEDRARLQLRLGRAADAAAELARLVEEDPLRERAHALLMLALYRSGRQAAALAAYEAVRTRLAVELGIDPGPQLRELRQRILTADPTILADRDEPPRGAPPVAPVTPGQLPAAVAAFTGRAGYLRQLDRLAADETTTAVVVAGTAGVGKTALTVTWAHRVRARYPDGQLYGDLRGFGSEPPVRPVEVLARFLRTLGMAPDDIPVEQDEAAAQYRTLLTGKRVLVVLDNARDSRQVRALLPGSPGCLTLVTSRDTLGGLVARDGARSITLDVLAPDEAGTLLARLLGPDAVAAEAAAAAELARLCANLPLALRIAAANLARRPGGIAGCVEALRTGDRLAALTVPGDDETAVRAAFDHSYATLPDAVQRLLRLLGLVPGPDVTAEAAAALAGDPLVATIRALDQLTAAHLATEQTPGRYALRDLLRHYAQQQARAVDETAACDTARMRLLDHYLHRADEAAGLLYPQMVRLPVPDPCVRTAGFEDAARALAWLDAERANLVAAIGTVAEPGPQRLSWLLADAMRGYFWLRRHPVEWLATAGRARTMAVEQHEPRAQAAAELSLGLAHYSQGRFTEATQHYSAALELARRTGWLEGQAASLGNLGNVESDLGRLSVAAHYQSEAMRLNRLAWRPGQAANLNSLGAVYREWGELDKAANLYAQALALHQASGSQTGIAVALTNLGEVYHELGRLPEALESLHAAVRLCRQAGIRDGEADALDNLAGVERDTGHCRLAAEHAGMARDLARDIGDRRTEAEALSTLASVSLHGGLAEDAFDRYREARVVARQIGNRFCEVVALTGLAASHRLLGRPRQALNAAHLAVDLARAGRRGRPRDGLPVGAVVHAVVRRGRPAAPARLRRASTIIRSSIVAGTGSSCASMPRVARICPSRPGSPLATRTARPSRTTGCPAALRAVKVRAQSSVCTAIAVVSPMMSCSLPSATRAPSDIRRSRSHCSASCMLCVVTSTPTPASDRSRTVSHSRVRDRGSTPDVGSSSSSTSGEWDRAAINATCRWAPRGRSRIRTSA
jgi:DNA-binding SARP family transcriptional activator